MIGQLTYSQSLEPLNSKFTGIKMQYSERNFKYSKSIFDYNCSIACILSWLSLTPSLLSATLPANVGSTLLESCPTIREQIAQSVR